MPVFQNKFKKCIKTFLRLKTANENKAVFQNYPVFDNYPAAPNKVLVVLL